MKKQLMRSKHNRVFKGVCGGIGEYFGISPVLVRLLWILAIFLGFSGIIAYFICLLIMPEAKHDYYY